ncbi:MAG TPA: hypothetical protein PKY77_09515 [Phycisphaerae bacterium]|nr:hypothetical protein [Phycisphaerae bacterium]HRY69847.1 hypothetical protein [Phycisphaerae bacterium]HSA25426.1 hypothetical protein [Phycisphaerae bacterium]
MRLRAMVRKLEIALMTMGLGAAFSIPGCDPDVSNALINGLGETAVAASQGITETAFQAIQAMFTSGTQPASTTMGGGTVPSV